MDRSRQAERSRWLLGEPPSAPLLLDAAMGTRLIARGLDLSGDDPALWNLDRPEEVAEVHRLDLLAGSDAVTTNTFGANRAWLSRLGRADQVGSINRAAVALAREAAGPDRFVFGCIGPTAAPDGGPKATEAESEQAVVLADCGVDALILETNATLSALLGFRLEALHELVGLPLIVTFALAKDDDPLPPITFAPREVLLLAIGWNCIPPGRAVGLPDRLRRPVPVPMALQPSGPWVGTGPPAGPTPEAIARLVDRGVLLFGGCCGTTERDIDALRSALGPSPFRPAAT